MSGNTNANTNTNANSLITPGEMPSRSSMRLMETAFKQRWPISDEIRKIVCNRMALIVAGNGAEQYKIAAARVLVAADAVNVARDRNDIQKEQGPSEGIGPVTNVTIINNNGEPNRPAMDAAAAFIAAVASDAGQSGGSSVVLDAREVQRPAAHRPAEPEADGGGNDAKPAPSHHHATKARKKLSRKSSLPRVVSRDVSGSEADLG